MAALPKNLPLVRYSQARGTIRDGDLFFCSGNSILDKLIKQGTNSDFSHCGMLFWWGHRLLAMESIAGAGVRAIVLSRYVNDFDNQHKPFDGRIFMARHQKMKLPLQILSHALDYLGEPYGTEQIVDILGRLTLGINHYQTTDALICSEYIALCFKAAQPEIDIQPAAGGFWYPGTIADDPNVQFLYELNLTEL